MRDCIQIQLRERPYVRSDVSQGGDSGSWVLAQGLDGLHWVGMLIGGDGERAGIVPAARLIDYFSQKTGYVLTPAIQTWA